MLTHLNYPIDESYLISLYEEHKAASQVYSDPRYQMPARDWSILKMDPTLFSQIFQDLGIQGSPRFYHLPKFGSIPVHRDNGTLCSINFILGDLEPASLNIEGKEHFYRQAVLDTQKLHSVQNKSKDRLLFKISIFDLSYEEVVKRIRFKL